IAFVGELNGVGDEVFEHLLEAGGVSVENILQARGEGDVKAEALRLGDVAEGAIYEFLELREGNLGYFDGRGARFDLGEIEDVVYEGKEVAAGGLDGAGILDLFAGEVTIGIFGKLLGED